MWDEPKRFRCAALSTVKHDYVAQGVVSHPRFELVVVADDPDVPDWAHARNQKFADRFSVPYVRDVERALADFNVDVAIVSSEIERHCDLSIRAALAGMHVVQDKPLTMNRADADRLVDTIQRTGVRFLMWNRSLFPAILQARQQIVNGVIGQPIAIHVDFYFAKDAGPKKATKDAADNPINWLMHQIAAHIDGSDGALGNEPIGELSNEGIYPLAYIHCLIGTKVERVFARATPFFHQVYVDNGVEDLASVTLEMEGGVVGSIAIGRIGAASHPSGGEIKLVIQGTKGSLVINESGPEVGVYYVGQPDKEARQRRVSNQYDYLLAQNFADAIDQGVHTLLDAPASRHIFATCEAALESSRTGQPVDVR